MALTDKLTAIGDAIREKTGGTELMTLDAMPTEIASIQTGGGGDLPEEALTITGGCGYRFANGGWDWFIENYGNKVTTKDITVAEYMFWGCNNLTEIPFEIKFADGGGNMQYMFSSCRSLVEIPDIDCKHTFYKEMQHLFNYCNSLKNLPYLYNAYPSNIYNLFENCYTLKEIPEDYFDTWDFSRLNNYNYGNVSKIFHGCYGLRYIPQNVLSKFGKETVAKAAYNHFFNSAFAYCYTLEELTNLPFSSNMVYTSNIFSNTFTNCSRLKEITFETDDTSAAKSAKWKSQTIDLSASVGYALSSAYGHIVNYGGINANKQVTDDTTYQALKDDSDWFTTNVAYSRYNHDSAVATINSLPDTSKYLATAGGTNTIKFKGESGSLTDGGAINILTAEEIAVATAKGWTVTFV